MGNIFFLMQTLHAFKRIGVVVVVVAFCSTDPSWHMGGLAHISDAGGLRVGSESTNGKRMQVVLLAHVRHNPSRDFWWLQWGGRSGLPVDKAGWGRLGH